MAIYLLLNFGSLGGGGGAGGWGGHKGWTWEKKIWDLTFSKLSEKCGFWNIWELSFF